MKITQVQTVNLRTILSETKRIVKANNTDFIALYIFFLPLAFSLVITPTLHLHLSGSFFTVDLFHNSLANNQTLVTCHLLYILIVYLLTLCAIGTIGYSTYNVFIGTPVNFFTSLKSLTFIFFPLVSTAIIAHLVLLLISLTFLLFVGMIVMLGKSLGILVIDYNSIYFMWFSIATIIGIIIYFHMNWCLVFMVVVAESKWGFAALMRSWYLVKGMRSVSLSLLLYNLICNGGMAWSFSYTVYFCAFRRETLSFVLLTMFGSIFLMLCLVMNTAANTVFYMYCKAFHGELELEIGYGFNNHYINLPSSDDTVVGA
ncbi:unnamed protein product [Lactuca virosa]|uniref:Transmembrane protein n=1 Tax=Lactuca virosa TaxID=75947 RepID=A0AAU9MXG1_9ASTR|nr:unnamed protein product [Lactuca virosa]